jgi:hypothetical protein
MTLIGPRVWFTTFVAASFVWVSFASDFETNRFGFNAPENYPLDNGMTQLHVGDIDGDGLNDLIVVNNFRSKINILYNQTGKQNILPLPVPVGKFELNDLPPDARFRVASVPSEKRISSLVVADLNGDGRLDLAYYGEPKELIVQYNQGTNGWSAPKHWPIEDGQLSANALCEGDLNGDGRPDLALLAENHVYVLFQKEDHTLDEPVKIPFSGSVKSVQIVDIDGDGRSDLLLVNWEDRNPFRFRLQTPSGLLGPENYFSYPPIRSYWADNLEPTGKTQIVTIALNSGRAAISEFVRKPAEPLVGGLSQGQLQILPLAKTDKARRGVLWADVDGDGLPDLLVAQPESGLISLYLQQTNGALAAPRHYPTLAGITDLAAADWEGDGKAEIFMLSWDEKQVGVTRQDAKGRLPFPTLIPLDGKPLILAAGKLTPDPKPVLAMIVEQAGNGDQELSRSLVIRSADGKVRTQKIKGEFRNKPTSLAFHDVDQDGLTDLVLLAAYEKVKIFRQLPGQEFEEIDVAPPGGTLEQPWLATADIDGDGKPELLLTQKSFLRAVVLKPEDAPASSSNSTGWTFTVKEQINGSSSNSKLMGAAMIRSETNSVGSLFVLDAERKALTICERDKAGVWQAVRNVPLPFSEFHSLQPLALGANNGKALAFSGLNAVAYMPLNGDVWQLNELDGYETPIRDGHLTDVISGDLDNDGRKDLVFLESARNYLDLVIFDEHHKLVPANRWQVFEEKTFRARRSDLPEPREAVVADVTGDGKNDLIVLVHDRILVYPQE